MGLRKFYVEFSGVGGGGIRFFTSLLRLGEGQIEGPGAVATCSPLGVRLEGGREAVSPAHLLEGQLCPHPLADLCGPWSAPQRVAGLRRGEQEATCLCRRGPASQLPMLPGFSSGLGDPWRRHEAD